MLHQHRYSSPPQNESQYEPDIPTRTQNWCATQSAGPHRTKRGRGHIKQPYPTTAACGTLTSPGISGTYKRYDPYLKDAPPVERKFQVHDVRLPGEGLEICGVKSSGNLSKYIFSVDLSLPPVLVCLSPATCRLLFNGNARIPLSQFLELR
ncbi:hypothetical protein BDZ94DRAFT_1254331 [Collybia nuda]|uniref:Uncharacterized protein n=1 Tax=Collybia nuda TaxID=64659 RepID=A0A9P5YAM2_9AGAR|nr:hypothetical protein BDZ94DRAFT_1254331 [Collybia nuda]